MCEVGDIDDITPIYRYGEPSEVQGGCQLAVSHTYAQTSLEPGLLEPAVFSIPCSPGPGLPQSEDQVGRRMCDGL